MTMQQSVLVRNNRLNSIEATIGASPVLKLRTGPAPASCAAADQGTVVATLNLPADWLNDATGGVKTKSGTWEDPQADAAGTVGHFRIYASDGVTCHLQGTVTISGSGGDMTLDNNVLALNQDVIISDFSISAGNA